jgi:PAS domain S-box-containing protein
MSRTTSDLDLLEGVVRSAIDYAIISLDERNAVTTWSAGAETLLGWKADEILGQSGTAIFTPEDRDRNVPEMEMAAARREGRAEDNRCQPRNFAQLTL